MAKEAELPKPHYEITGEELLLSKLEKLPCLIEPFLQQSGLACLGGSSDTGKSSLLRQMAIAIATGSEDFLGFKINSIHKSVIYVATEDDINATTSLLKRQAGKYKPEMLKGLRFMFEPDNLYSELDRRLSARPADLVIIDCFADVFGDTLNDTHLIRQFLNKYQRLSSTHNCLILFLHHTGKRTEDLPPSKNHLLGGQGFEAKMRLVMEFRADNLGNDVKHLCIVKGNYLGAIYKTKSYVLKLNEETLSFHVTGHRVPFENLAKPSDDSREKFAYAAEMRQAGMKMEDIANELGYKSKGSASKLLAKGDRLGWGENEANTNEGEETKE